MFVNPLDPGSKAPISYGNLPVPITNQQPLPKPAENSLPRYLNFLADYTGCGHWRMLWPEQVLNSYRHCVLQSSTVMCTDPKHFHGVECIRVQRQATPTQRKYLEFLKHHVKARLVYEIDDICFGEDIPEYNPFRSAFTSDETRQDIQYMMEFCDEMTVTCDAMREYFLNKTNQKNITVLPNYPSRAWIGRMFDRKSTSSLYDKHRKQPRVLYAGSSSHFDCHLKNNLTDDMTHVIDEIINTRNKFKWIFLGGLPRQLQKYVDNGDIEFHKWVHLHDYPYKVKELNINAMVAPLDNNIFNKCKSNIKYLEGCAMGIPVVCQDIDTYKLCNEKFTTGSEMISLLQNIFDSKKMYMKIVDKNYSTVDKLWLESKENRMKYFEVYKYPYGHPDRHNINKLNDITKENTNS